jgi:adenylate cyclase
LKLYRSREFTRAIDSFEKALSANAKDKPSTLYLERCRAFMETPPPEDWGGEWIMTEK